MAVRRARGTAPLERLRHAHLARVRRTTDKVEQGRVPLEAVVADLREFVEEELSKREIGLGRART